MSNDSYRIENAQLVGHEWQVKLSFVTEYKFSLIAGHEREDAVRDAEELALFGDKKRSDRFLAHSETEPIRDIYEDDVEAGRIEWLDEPTAPSEDTFWDDSVHFPDDDWEVRTDGGFDPTCNHDDCEEIQHPGLEHCSIVHQRIDRETTPRRIR